MKIALASQNENKLRELRPAFPDWSLELLPSESYPPEQGETYVDNARAKARYGRTIAPADSWVVAEDSGLEVDGLDGRPGIHSARYAEPGGDPVEKLLDELASDLAASRQARYVCELVCLSPEDTEYRGRGVLDGTISEEARGSEGFGYDPVFVPTGEQKTVAELGDSWKVSWSHRARAAADLRAAIEARTATAG